VFDSVDEVDILWAAVVGSSFLIQFAKRCLLMGELSQLTFRVSIDRHMVIPVI
jgi:hypothetical protein